MDAASGAHIERPRDRRRQLYRRERERRAPDTEHVVLRKRAAERGLVEVARDPPLPVAAGVGERLRSDEREGPDIGICVSRPHDLREPESPEPLDPCARERPFHVVGGLRHSEHEQTRQHRHRVVATREAAQRRSAKSSHDGIIGRRTPAGPHGLRGVPRIAQVFGERAAELWVGVRRHGVHSTRIRTASPGAPDPDP